MYGCEHTCVLIHLVCFCKQRGDNGHIHALTFTIISRSRRSFAAKRWLTFCRQLVSKFLADVRKLQDASPHRAHAVIRVHRDLGPLSGGGEFTQRLEALQQGRHAGYLLVGSPSLHFFWVIYNMLIIWICFFQIQFISCFLQDMRKIFFLKFFVELLLLIFFFSNFFFLYLSKKSFV